jgi:hypothetical protein
MRRCILRRGVIRLLQIICTVRAVCRSQQITVRVVQREIFEVYALVDAAIVNSVSWLAEFKRILEVDSRCKESVAISVD